MISNTKISWMRHVVRRDDLQNGKTTGKRFQGWHTERRTDQGVDH